MRCLILLLNLFAVAAIAAAEDPRRALAVELLNQARHAIEVGAPDKALGALAKLDTLVGAPPELRSRGTLLSAYLYAQRKEFATSARLFAEAATAPGISAAERQQARISAAGLRLGLNQPQAALEHLDAASAAREERVLRGRILLRLRRFEEAIAILKTVLEESTAAADEALYMDLIGAYQESANWQAAITTLVSLLEISPARAQRWQLLGDYYLRVERPRDAAAAWQTALLNGQTDLPHRLRLAELYLYLGLPQATLASLGRAIEAVPGRASDPALIPARALSARALEMLRQPEAALERWLGLIEQTDKPDYLLAAARLAARLQRWREADRIWQQLLRTHSARIAADDLIQAAVSAYRNGRPEAAAAVLERAAADPDGAATARQWLAYIKQTGSAVDAADQR